MEKRDEMNKKKAKRVIKLAGLVLLFFVVLILTPQLIDTVEKGTYQVKQAAFTGNMSAKLTPGIWPQLFGSIDVWPKAETFFFTHNSDTKGDVVDDTSMQVRFNDGSVCNVSGTLRIIMPSTEAQAVYLPVNLGYKTYKDVQEKLIKPTVRNVLRSTANLMSAKDSYSTRRAEYITCASDQIQNGLYETEDEVRDVTDLVSGEKVRKTFNVIKRVKGIPVYQNNPLKDTGITLSNFEIKSFIYEDKVKKQIAEQQTALMDVQTSKANAQKAEQAKLTTIAQGKERVAKAEYKELELKIVAIVQAERDKEQAIIQANKKKEMETIAKEQAIIEATKKRDVAKLNSAAAGFTRDANIKLGNGEAHRKKVVMQADGALEQKLAAWKAVNFKYAANMGKQKWAPEINMGGSNNSGSTANDLISLFTAKTAKDLQLDMSMKTSKQATRRIVKH